MKSVRIISFFIFYLVTGVVYATPHRIVSIAPGFTEILYALGLDHEVVGTTNYCDYPEEAKHTEKIGDMLNPNLEKIISLHPDLVFCGTWKWHVPETLRQLGIKVVEIKDAQSIEDIFDRILVFGTNTGKEQEAAGIVAEMKKGIEEIHARAEKIHPQPKVYMELDSGQWTVGAGSYMSQVLEIIGLENIFQDRKDAYFMATLESIASRDPDLIISLWRNSNEYGRIEMWQALRAVQENKILDLHSMNWDLIARQSPRLVEGMAQLQRLAFQTLQRTKK